MRSPFQWNVLLVACAWFMVSESARGQQLRTEVHADGQVTIRLAAPFATNVRVFGDFVTGAQPMQRGDAGIWSLTVGPLAPELYDYGLSVNGVEWAAGTLEVPAPAPALYDVRSVPHGAVEHRWYASRVTETTRGVVIYTPPGYARSSQRYPVLYLFHGAGGDEGDWTRNGRLNWILDNLIATGTLTPLVVVMPYGYAYPPTSPLAQGTDPTRRRDLLNRDVREELVPFVQANYRVRADRASRAVAGLSLGGAQALAIGLSQMDLFSRIAAFSPALGGVTFPQTGSLDFKSLVGDVNTVNQRLALFWIGCGTEDGLFKSIEDFNRMLTANGVTHTFRATEGKHNFQVWRRHLAEVAPSLFR